LEELKAKGVEFVSEPKDQFYCVEAVFKDPFGNWFSLTQPKRAGLPPRSLSLKDLYAKYSGQRNLGSIFVKELSTDR
jgi:hypothetical protein